jgi:HlyD family secretion protein
LSAILKEYSCLKTNWSLSILRRLGRMKIGTFKTGGVIHARFPLRITAWALGAVILLALVWFKYHQPIPVVTILVERGRIVKEVFGTGTLESKVVINVSSKIVGKVVAVNVDEGDSVSEGQCLAQLESSDFANAVRVSVMQREQAQAQLEKAIVDSTRQQALFAKQLASQADIDLTNTAYRVALANVNAAEASIEVAKAKLADTRIISPLSGLVITRNLELGSTIVPGAAILRISGSRPWVVTQVDERETGGLRLGQHARITFEANPGKEYSGNVVRLSPEVDRVTEEREVDVGLDSLPQEVFLGARANVFIETNRKPDVLKIPLAAIVVQDGKSGVYVVEKGKAHWKSVQFGLKGRDTFEVLDGLKPDEPIIQLTLQNRALISDGTRVKATMRRNGR